LGIKWLLCDLLRETTELGEKNEVVLIETGGLKVREAMGMKYYLAIWLVEDIYEGKGLTIVLL
jgi:hypothetical protein